MRYRLLKNQSIGKIINAQSELEAKVKYCEEMGFNYRIYARMLEVTPKEQSPTIKRAFNSPVETR